jgi:hypothetical protein
MLSDALFGSWQNNHIGIRVVVVLRDGTNADVFQLLHEPFLISLYPDMDSLCFVVICTQVQG